MMKKTGLLLLLVFIVGVCCACASGVAESSPNQDGSEPRIASNDIPIECAAYEMGIAFHESVDLNAEAAAEIADSVLSSLKEKGYFEGYQWFETEDLLLDGVPAWAVYYSPAHDIYTLVPEVVIAIQKSNAEILGIWVNEG